MPVRYPRPLVPGDTVAVTAPSAGVPAPLRPRLDVAVEHVRARGYGVLLGDCLDDLGITIAPAADRAAELTRLLTDPAVRAVVPPWGGEMAVDLLDRLDWDALAADPTWFVGYSDISTLLTPLTLLTGVATLHGQNLMDTPYDVPPPLLGWLDVVATPAGEVLNQGPAEQVRATGYDDYAADPAVSRRTFDTAGGWRRLDGEGDVQVTGRLVGGCLETVSALVGTPFGDVRAFADAHAPEGLLVYLEVAEVGSPEVARRLFQLRYAGWFEHATGILIGRTGAPGLPSYSQDDAVRDALGGLGIPIVADVDCGHVPPTLCLVNGALATATHTGDGSTLAQHLVP